MEPSETKVAYAIHTTVLHVKEIFRNNFITGSGKDARFSKDSLGWYVTFDGSYEAIYFGETKPQLNVGDKIKITFERIPNANTSQSPVK